ncbi:MAG: hypothetical protein SGJ18_16375 [Pseudomonadota bacterium]|nr:hypothetical protein [Pseudomonadota bacterium]
MIFLARHLSILMLGSTLLTSCTCQDSKKKRNARPVVPKTQPTLPPADTPPTPSSGGIPSAEPNMVEGRIEKRPGSESPPNSDLGTFENSESQMLNLNLKNLISVNLLISSEKLELTLITNKDNEAQLERLVLSGQLVPKGNFSPFATQSEKNKSTKAEARCANSCERILVKLKKPGIGELHLAFEAPKKETGWAHLAFLPGLTEGPDAQVVLKRSHLNEELLAMSGDLDLSSGNAQGVRIEANAWLTAVTKNDPQDAEVMFLTEELNKLISLLVAAGNELNSSVEDIDIILLAVSIGSSTESLKETMAKLERALQSLELGFNTLRSVAELISGKYLPERAVHIRMIEQDLARILAVTRNALERLPSITKLN